MTGDEAGNLVLAAYATTRGFAFTLCEGPISPIEWGSKEYRGADRNARCVRAITRLIDRYHPDALVIENSHSSEWRRAERIGRLYQAIEEFTAKQAIAVFTYDRAHVRACFRNHGAYTKQERAELIAKQIPAFSYRAPPPRRLWMSEHPRMGLFEAAALSITHFYRNQ